MEVKRKAIPIEAKYRSKLPETTINEIEEFMKEKKSPIGFVITKDLFRTEGKIIKLPLWLFLLIV